MQRVAEHVRALGRGVVWTGVAALAWLAAAVQFAAFVPGFGLGLVLLLPPVLLLARRVPRLARRLAGAGAAQPVPESYRPRPAPPMPGPDGRYERERILYRSPWVPRAIGHLDWVLGDPATWRDLGWMLLAPVSAFLAGLPAALVAGGGWLAVTGGQPWAVPAGLVALAAGPALAPALLRLHDRWNRRLLGPPRAPARSGWRHWLGVRVVALFRLLALAGLTLLGIPVALLVLLATVLSFGVGLVPLFQPVVRGLRLLTNLRRRLAGRWSGRPVAEPYRPRPELPPLRPDGLYPVGRHLYRSPRAARYAVGDSWVRRDPATWRDITFAIADPFVGVVLLAPLVAVGYGIRGLVLPWLVSLFTGNGGNDWYGALAGSSAAALPVGVALTVLGLAAAPAALRWHGRWTALLLGPTRRAELDLRVRRLTETRADATREQATELRRIERDLHDGTQARLIALGLTLNQIDRLLDQDPAAARALLAEARAASTRALGELRDLVRGIHPPVLAERGLGDAVRSLALEAPLPVEVTVSLPQRPEEAVESAVYFAVQELLGNVLKHAQAQRVRISLAQDGAVLRVRVADDGRGGADPGRGSGLHGLRRRLGTFDATVTVDSPVGGPTIVELEVPCASSSPRISTC